MSKRILFLLSLLTFNLFAQPTERRGFKMTWAINDAPPFHIVDGELQNAGMCDVLIDALKQHMTFTHHDIVLMPQTRIKMLTKQKENLCFPCLIKRQDNDVWVYSDPTVTHAPLGIIGRPDVLELYIGESGRVSLKALVENKRLRMGKPLARRYPEPLQVLIDSLRTRDNFAELSGENATDRVLSQIEAGRLDYTLEYPSILKFHNITSGQSAKHSASHRSESLVYYETEELGNAGVVGAIGCTSNEWGAQAIQKINAALPYVLSDPIYQKQQAFWYGEVNSPTRN